MSKLTRLFETITKVLASGRTIYFSEVLLAPKLFEGQNQDRGENGSQRPKKESIPKLAYVESAICKDTRSDAVSYYSPAEEIIECAMRITVS